MIIRNGKRIYLDRDLSILIDSYLDGTDKTGDISRSGLVNDILTLVNDQVRGALEDAWMKSNLEDKLIGSL